MKPITRAELIAHIRATAERMAQTALLMQYYGGLGEIAQHGRDMEGAARIVHGWAGGIEADGRPVFTKHEQPPTNEPQGPQAAGLFHRENMTIQTIENAIARIAAQVLGIDPQDANAATPIPGSRMQEINDETCMALNINISASRAGQCQTVGQYVQLVQEERANP